MAQIVINEISSNYTYNIGAAEFATVALPITASWGPAFMDSASILSDPDNGGFDEMMEGVHWLHFPATSDGLSSFVQTYRSPASNYKITEDYSYQMAVTLLTAGYDVLVCRLCPGTMAQATFNLSKSGSDIRHITIKAKYPGSFGNSLNVRLTKISSGSKAYWNLIVYIVNVDSTAVAVENLVFVLDADNETDNISFVDDVKSNYITIIADSGLDDTYQVDNQSSVVLSGGLDTFKHDFEKSTDSSDTRFYVPLTEAPVSWDSTYQSYYQKNTNGDGTFINIPESTPAPSFVAGKYFSGSASESSLASSVISSAKALALSRFTSAEPLGAGYTNDQYTSSTFYTRLNSFATPDITFAEAVRHQQWIYNYAYYAYYALTDKLNYAPNRIICPGWDDQNICSIDGSDPYRLELVSPLHKKLMNVAYHSRCATALIDIPRSCARKYVYDESSATVGYAQLLARIQRNTVTLDVNAELYSSHSALFAPWGQYKLVGMGRQVLTSPSMLALLIQRAQMLNQPLQYEWALPTNRKHNLRIGEMEYKVTKKLMDEWQSLSGVGVNIITAIPDLGTNIWGNSTLFEVPVATYQALANLSTRYLVNAVEGQAYKCGISITFQYNNASAYENFYAGMTPLLDTMKNVGAIDDYYMTMAADIDGLAQVNANSVIGKIYLVIPGVINDITIDLIALPPGTDLAQFGA